jgi:uncharacterized caspase-like protein
VNRSLVSLAIATMISAPIAARAETRFALVVGRNVGDVHESPLRWAEADAERVRDVLLEIGNVAPDRTVTLMSPSAAEAREAQLELKGRIAEANRRGEHTVLLFYYSGHGDSESLHFGEERVFIESLKKDLSTTGAATVLAILDACRNQRTPGAREKGATRAPGFAWPEDRASTPDGFVLLTSAAKGEVAQESDDLMGSLFTHHLLSGLRGSADTDEDGTVTLSEIYAHGYQRTLEDTHKTRAAVQHGELDVRLSGSGSFVVTYPRRAAAMLSLAADLSGDLLVIDDGSGRVVSEVHLAGGRSFGLAVPPGKYRLHLRGEKEIRSGIVLVREGTRVVALGDLPAQPTLAALTKGSTYDPHPHLIAVGGGIGSSMIAGFGPAPALHLGVARRLSGDLAAGLFVSMSYARSENRVWSYRQLELSLLGGVDFVLPFRSSAFTVGARAGVAIAAQSGDRKDAARTSVLGAEVTHDSQAIGPRAALPIGIEFHPLPRFGLRVELEPAIWWLPMNGELPIDFGLSGTLAVLFRV